MKRAKTQPKRCQPTQTAVPHGCSMLSKTIQLTKWTAPTPITKQLALAPDGTITKLSTANQLYEGTIERLECTPAEFARLLARLGAHDCLSYGVPIQQEAITVMTKKNFDLSGHPADAMPRTADKMVWTSGPAILMGDYDPDPGSCLTPDQLRSALYSICPAFQHAAHIWTPSTSSCLFKGRTQVRGIEGQRLYFVVADGTDIPRAAKVLEKRAWLAGHGYVKISKAGSLLARWILDGAVFQTNRIDYCAPAVCVSPLRQRKPAPVLHGSINLALDTRVALPDLTAMEEAKYRDMVSKAKAAKQAEAAVVRTAYKALRVKELVDQGVAQAEADSTVSQALENQVLLADFRLVAEDGRTVTVAELLADKNRWHGKQFADPVEPDYHGDRRIARAFLIGCRRPFIKSFAHGGCLYYLHHAKVGIQLVAGHRHQAMEDIVGYLSAAGSFYRRANTLVAINEGGKFAIINESQTLVELDRQFSFVRHKQEKALPADATTMMAKLLCEGYVDRFPKLNALITAPILDPKSGRLITQPGYDEATGTYLDLPDNLRAIPLKPTMTEVDDALRTIWYPVHLFPFASKLDQAVMTTAILTAVVRALLPTAPGFAFDAPTQSSGKTLLIKVLATLMGATPAMSPVPAARDDEETRKRLFAALRGGSSVIVFDNIVGEFDSPSLASMLTSETYEDRVLGASRNEALRTNALTLLSGNNLVLKGDLPRRFLSCRIDPNSELPHTRSFPFDPVEVVRQYRQEVVAAALTLLLAYQTGRTSDRVAAGCMGSFEAWDAVVRQAVCWLALKQQEGVISGGMEAGPRPVPYLCDPMIAVNKAVVSDPMRSLNGRLLIAIAAAMPGHFSRTAKFTSKTLIDICERALTAQPVQGQPTNAQIQALKDVVSEIAAAPGTGMLNPRILGKALPKFVDRICGGYCLRAGDHMQNAATYWVEKAPGELSEFGEAVSAQKEKSQSNVILIAKKKLTSVTKLTHPKKVTSVPLASASTSRGGKSAGARKGSAR